MEYTHHILFTNYLSFVCLPKQLTLQNSVNKLRAILKCVDCSPLHSRTIQLLLCSICLISFGIFHPIFVLVSFFLNSIG